MDNQNNRIAFKGRDAQHKTEHPGPSCYDPSTGRFMPAGHTRRNNQVQKPSTSKSHAADIERLLTTLDSFHKYCKPTPLLILFLVKKLYRFAVYRQPMPVREYVRYQGAFGKGSVFFLCPRCDLTMEREFQSFCDRCGQSLNWKRIEKAELRTPKHK